MSRDHLLRALSAHLAENLRQARERRDLTQAKLSRLAGVPRSTIASIETGSGNPTMAVLASLALALQLSLEELLAAPKARCEIFRKGSLPTVRRGRDSGAVVAKLLPHPIPGMEIDRLELASGGRLVGVPHRPGTHEYLCCEKGRLGLRVAGESFELTPGDVAAFAGDQRHSYEGLAAGRSVGFSVVTLAPVRGLGA